MWETPEEKENWETLIYAIQQQNCILMLGPDTAIEAVNGKPQPLTEILANQLAERIEPKIKNKINKSDLAQVSQYYYMEKGRISLEARVSAFYNERQNLTSNLHRNLAALPFYFTITTAPDNIFADALGREGKEPITERYHFNGDNPEIVKMGTLARPLVFYLYGTVAEPRSLLLTENDLLDFLVGLISEKRPLPDTILSELHDRDKSFLFLGFGFSRWYLRLLLHVLQGRGKESRSFAMEQFMPENVAELQQTIFFFEKSEYKINIFKSELDPFAEQLRKKYEQSSPFKLLKAPEVFICHASEDKDYAASLYKTLEEAGIRPWLDKENLRGGDDWSRKIEETIKQIDYFVILQSKALANKRVGYVNREINIALDHMKNFRRGTRFIIPVKIEECPELEEIANLQTIDLTDKNNMKKLVSTIKRDFEWRGN